MGLKLMLPIELLSVSEVFNKIKLKAGPSVAVIQLGLIARGAHHP